MISFNLEGLMDPRMIANSLSKHFTPDILIDDIPRIGYHGLSIRFSSLSVHIPGLKITGLELELFSLEKMRLIFMNLSKLTKLIRVF